MPSDRVSKRCIDGLACPPGKDRVFLWDNALKGFGVICFASGKCTFVVQFRKAGRTQRHRIGDYGRLTPEEARSRAKQFLGAVEQGGDPSAVKKEAQATPTVDQLIAEFLSQEVHPKRAPSKAKLYALYLEKRVSPVFGSRPATRVNRNDIARLHQQIGSQQPVTANRVLKVISGLYAFALNRGHIPSDAGNPAKGIDLFKEQSCERFLTSEELQRLGAALRESETVGIPWRVDETKASAKHIPKPEHRRQVHSPYVIGAIRLLLFTGCHLREILNLRWRDVDVERGMLFLTTSKTGKKTVILNSPATDVLTSLPRSGDYVIAGASNRARPDIKRPWQSIRARANLHELRLHDLRHSCASVGAGTGMGLPIIGKLLGHAQPSTTARYAHLDADPMQRAAEQIGVHISAALNGDLSQTRR